MDEKIPLIKLNINKSQKMLIFLCPAIIKMFIVSWTCSMFIVSWTCSMRKQLSYFGAELIIVGTAELHFYAWQVTRYLGDCMIYYWSVLIIYTVYCFFVLSSYLSFLSMFLFVPFLLTHNREYWNTSVSVCLFVVICRK